MSSRSTSSDLSSEGKKYLIKLVKHRRCIYSLKCAEYGHDVTGKWIDVSNEMEKQGFRLSVGECKGAWYRILCDYKRHLRSPPVTQLAMKSGTYRAQGRKQIQAYEFEDDLGFLEFRETQACRNWKNLKTSRKSKSKKDEDDSSSEDADSDALETSGSEDSDESRQNALVPSIESNNTQPGSDFRSGGASAWKRRKMADEGVDEFESYGNMLSSKLKKISEHDRKSFIQLQSAINDLVSNEELKGLGD